MYGMLMWTEEGKKGVEVKQRELLRVPFLWAAVRRTPRTPEMLLRRRVRKALGLLRKQGIGRIVTPQDFAWGEEMKKQDIYPVTTLPLRRELAADWMDAALLERGMRPAGTKAAVYADRITGELVQTVTELSGYLLRAIRTISGEISTAVRVPTFRAR